MEENITNLIAELVALGEDKDELEYWASIFPVLKPEEQAEIMTALETELAELKKFS